MGIYDILINRYYYTILYMCKILIFCGYNKKIKKSSNKFAIFNFCVIIIVPTQWEQKEKRKNMKNKKNELWFVLNDFEKKLLKEYYEFYKTFDCYENALRHLGGFILWELKFYKKEVVGLSKKMNKISNECYYVEAESLDYLLNSIFKIGYWANYADMSDENRKIILDQLK